MSDRLRVALIYDMDACKNPTGVTRHAMAGLRGLAKRPDVALRAVSGRIREPDGLAFWEDLATLPRREMPLRTRDMLRLWRMISWPPVECWTGPVDWVYAPAEYDVPTKRAKRAVTSHDILQDLTIGGPRRRDRLARTFGRADLILSVSHFNTARLLEAFPEVRDRVAYVPNAADDLFFEPPSDGERSLARADLGLPPGVPYLLSVASFQARKNLVQLVRSAGRLPEVARGELALVLLGAGTDAEADAIRRAIADLPRSAIVRMPGYRQGRALRAAYAEATALVFPSTCESFGIPAVEAMACGCPVALADTTALPEIGGDAGWYFNPEHDEAITSLLRDLLDSSDERARRRDRGREIAAGYRWDAAISLLAASLIARR